MLRSRTSLVLAALVAPGPAWALDAIQSTTVSGRNPPSAFCAGASAGGLSINRADRTITLCNPDGSQNVTTLLKALPSGRRAVEQGYGDDLLVRARGGSSTRTLDAILRDQPLYLTAYDVVSGQLADDALQRALVDCGATGRPVRIPAGDWRFVKTSDFPTGAGARCPGIEGEGAATVLSILDYNGPIIRATIQAGAPQNNKIIRGLSTQGQWSSASPVYDQSALIEIIGASAGWSYGLFQDLGGFAIKNIIRIGTDAAVASNDGLESHSGWNSFTGLYGGVGSQGIRPTDLVLHTKGSSTGNTFADLRGGGSRSFWRCEGVGYVCGDIVMSGYQSGEGRILSIGPNTNYNRNISLDGQVDAGSIELMQWDGGATPPSRLKVKGSIGGSAPWAGLPPIKHSEVQDLGGSSWTAGGKVVGYTGAGSHTVELWKVTLAPSTMARFEVSLTGLIGGVDGGGTIATMDAACAYNAVGQVVTSSPAIKISPNNSSVPAGWPAFSTVVAAVSGRCQVTVSATWTDGNTDTTLDTNINARHGAFKVVRGANVPL
ncbi:hypothetical protein [Methylobacterium aquaticum]|uniref:hypothetical protein n=1 Tax=Methylobacterium aquaticum TaxID=270351 RepID=UPI00193129BC|nr:hypothetical protein [Methylobacterium aquaticum]QRE74370.1 hypothetical protein F1D61_12815 [Methylobacterium aquaticum]